MVKIIGKQKYKKKQKNKIICLIGSITCGGQSEQRGRL